jgi:hypothetical protein
MIVIVGFRTVTGSTTGACDSLVKWSDAKKIDMRPDLLRRIESAAGEGIVEQAALDAEDQGDRGVSRLSRHAQCADQHTAANRAQPLLSAVSRF